MSEDLEHALAGGAPQRVGWFRFHFADQRWEWSPQVQQMHGYQPGTVVPTTELVLSHKHPDDYGPVAATLAEIRRTSGAFSTRHRIVDTRGENFSYHPDKLSMEKVGDAAFGPTDRIGQLTMRNLDIADSRSKLELYATQGQLGVSHTALVGRLTPGGAEQIAANPTVDPQLEEPLDSAAMQFGAD